MKGSRAKYLNWFVGVGALGMVAWAVIDPDTRSQFLTGPGLASGALIAAISLGVVITFRGSGVVNFANSAIAMYIAYVYAVLRKDGDLFLPPLPNPFALVEGVIHKLDSTSTLDLPDWPTRISFGPDMQFWPALLISLIFAVLLGLTLHFLVFRPLRAAPPLAKVVASIGLFLLLPAIIVRRFSIQPFAVEPMPFFSNSKPVDLPLGISMTADELAIAVLVIVLTIALSVLFQLTRFGLATRAASENEKGAVVLGFSSQFLAGANWVLSTVITGLLGIFAATVLRTIDPSVLPALIVPALTAALVGGFTSFGWTTVAAMVLGMQFGLVKYLEAQHHWYPTSNGGVFPGMERVLPLVVIVVVLFLRGKNLPTRGAISSGRLPFSPTPPRWAIRYGGPALALTAAVFGLFIFGPTFRLALANSLIGIIVCLSIVVITGYIGQISLAQMAFVGMSAFLVAKLTTDHNVPFPFPILIGATVAMAVGVIVALPALRVRGVNLAIVTLAFAVAVDRSIFANNSVNGGFVGAHVKVPKLIAQPRDVQYRILGLIAGDGKQPNPMTAIFCLVAVVILCYAVANLRRSATGRRMLATRSNERAAASAGVNVAGMKILVFAVSAFIAGIGGAVSAYRFGSVTPDKFSYVQSLTIFAFAYLGGIASVSGSIVGGMLVAGGLVFTFLSEKLGVPSEFTLILGGLGLTIAAVQSPEGIAGAIRQVGITLRRKLTPPARFTGGTTVASQSVTQLERVGASS